jgi:uncharacterized protein (TIGR02145 family)
MKNKISMNPIQFPFPWLTAVFLSLFPLVVFGQLKDVDGQAYRTQKIGSQTWMTENLNTSKFRNGDVIPEAKDLDMWEEAIEEGKPMWCFFNFDKKNEKIHGKLYNWFAVIDERGLAPEGWHVPTTQEFDVLISFAGGEDDAPFHLMASELWEKDEAITNKTGFSAAPSGTLYNSGEFEDLGIWCYLWSCSPINETRFHYFEIWMDGCFGPMLDNSVEAWIEEGLSVRCVKD